MAHDSSDDRSYTLVIKPAKETLICGLRLLEGAAVLSPIATSSRLAEALVIVRYSAPIGRFVGRGGTLILRLDFPL